MSGINTNNQNEDDIAKELALLGTFVLLCVYAMECKTTSFIDRLFKYTPKKDDDKKIKHNEEEDKRGWGGC